MTTVVVEEHKADATDPTNIEVKNNSDEAKNYHEIFSGMKNTIKMPTMFTEPAIEASLSKDGKLKAALFNEFQGVFILCCVVHCLVHHNVPMGALYAGATLMSLIYLGATVSGAHYNPAVTLALALEKKIDTDPKTEASMRKTALYFAAQLTAALLAAGVYYIGLQVDGTPEPTEVYLTTPTTHKILPLLFTEFLFTAFLTLTVFHTAVAKATTGNSYFGLAIGFTVIASGALRNPGGDHPNAGAVLYLGGLNPAVTLSLLVMNKISVLSWVIATAGEILGAVYAAVVFVKVTNVDMYQDKKTSEEAE